VKVQGGPEQILLETIDSFVVNSNFCACDIILAQENTFSAFEIAKITSFGRCCDVEILKSRQVSLSPITSHITHVFFNSLIFFLFFLENIENNN